MTITTKGRDILVELYDLPITNREDDRYGHVVSAGSFNEDDLVRIVISEGCEFDASTLKAAYMRLKNAAMEKARNGASVQFGLCHLRPTVNGVFAGDMPRWDPSQHSIGVNATPTAEFRKAMKSASVKMLGMASTGPGVNTVTDIVSGEVNTRLTPGGGVHVAGRSLKIVGGNPEVGLRLINQDTKEATVIPATSFMINVPSQVSFIVPAGLPTGDYKLSVCTQYASHNPLKTPRTHLCDYVLAVID